MTEARERVVWPYLANATLLIVHEIDSAFREEWELFHLPGGIELFLLLHVPLVAAVLLGAREVILWRGRAGLASYVLAGAGVFAFGIHLVFIAGGDEEFRNVVSLAVLTGALVVSAAQVVATRRVAGQSPLGVA
jgi:hypothetical protein